MALVLHANNARFKRYHKHYTQHNLNKGYTMKSRSLIFLLIGVMISYFTESKLKAIAAPKPLIIPQPQSLTVNNGYFTLKPNAQFATTGKTGNIASYLSSILPLKKSSNETSAPIQLNVSNSLLKQLGNEGYTMSVTQKGIKINAATPAGIFYGIQTLRQLLPPTTVTGHLPKNGCTIPCLEIKDYPRFQWRGLMIDPCRHFFTVEEIKKMIDAMVLLKMNTLHLHLTDDQGWRIEIKKYPKLTEVGSVRDASPKRNNRKRTDGKKYGPYFYTQEQIKDIVKYAQNRFVTVVPEIEIPGHSLAALAAYPELGCTGGPYKVRTKWGIEPDIYCAGNPKTYKFMEDVLTEVMELFPSEFVHMGGDEAPKKRWDKCPKCQAVIKKEGLKNSHELQSYVIQHFDKFLASHGRRLIGWDEILEGGLAPGAAVMSWRGERGGIKAAKMNHDVVMSPNSYCYLDHYESRKKGEPESIGGFLPMKKVYSYDPTPRKLTDKEKKHILGVQGNLWSEYIWTPEELEYKAFPRACALAEVAWTMPNRKDYTNYLERLTPELERLKAMGVNFRQPDPEPSIIAKWDKKNTPAEFTEKDIDITKYIKKAGKYYIGFHYKKGAKGLDIAECNLLANNKIISSDQHVGFTGLRNKKNIYTVKLDKFIPGTKYSIRIKVKGAGGTDSQGYIDIKQ